MSEQFRTTVSAVFWTETTEDAEAIANSIKTVIPEVDRDATLVTIEYKAGGRPVTELPPEEPPAE